MKVCIVHKPVIVRESFETASWYRMIELKPGVYEMRHDTFGVNDHYVARIDGVVTDASFQSSFCGNPFGDKSRGKEEVGRGQQYSVYFKDGDFSWGRKSLYDGAVTIEDQDKGGAS